MKEITSIPAIMAIGSILDYMKETDCADSFSPEQRELINSRFSFLLN